MPYTRSFPPAVRRLVDSRPVSLFPSAHVILARGLLTRLGLPLIIAGPDARRGRKSTCEDKYNRSMEGGDVHYIPLVLILVTS